MYTYTPSVPSATTNSKARTTHLFRIQAHPITASAMCALPVDVADRGVKTGVKATPPVNNIT
jgi:hypothetical protein